MKKKKAGGKSDSSYSGNVQGKERKGKRKARKAQAAWRKECRGQKHNTGAKTV